ncbi:3'-5' exonuclease [Gulosibacter sp. ACHW.36C]|uniref:DNA 3'-5' helicase n=1 Tax=Gulosibacter sediminis TaxID=1729695 RepID=A0ABY4MUB2_9MICO|nr:3'-5' exonuclease [Gulosibacter sediminis]UQN13959.1 AAA family ATPase [Gulosibacter sediminis]
MPQVIWAQQKSNSVDGNLKSKVFSFLSKLHDDDTTPGLHIEPMTHAADPRARTGRVDEFWRAVLFRLDPPRGEVTYVYTGVWPHDEAIEVARTRVLRVNPVNGVNEILEVDAEAVASGVDEVVERARQIADAQEKAAAATAQGLVVTPVLERKGYTLRGLVEELGFNVADAEELMAAPDDAALTAFVDRFTNGWQELAVIALLEGKPIDGILAEIHGEMADPEALEVVGEDVEVEAGDAVAAAATSDASEPVDDTAADEPGDTVGAADVAADTPVAQPEPFENEDERILRGFEHPAARRQFKYVDGQDELRRVIEAEDFGAWTVFLHPDQQHYVERNYAGTFRLTGGAGTGKTVILLHRARRLALDNPQARIVLTTYTRTLATMLSRDLQRLDPKLPLAAELGDAGIYVAGVDQLVAEVRRRWPREFNAASERVLGSSADGRRPSGASTEQWEATARRFESELGERLASAAFLEEEYLDIVLRERIASREEYLRASRLGSGTRLGRRQRVAVWDAIEQFRLSQKIDRQVAFAELAAIAAATLEGLGGMADHVLVDEGQDLIAPQWQFLRALAVPGPNDLFIAEDAHQRIYGRPVRMARVGIDLRGRSRRLKLNYRTTQETLDFALRALEGEEWVTGEGSREDVSGYLSARRGPEPRLVEAAGAQVDTVLRVVREWIDEGVAPSTVAVLARSRRDAQNIATMLGDQGIAARFVTPADEPQAGALTTMTMHQSKGHEFSRVLLYDISEGRFPVPLRRDATEAIAQEHRMHEAALLYVAATRARDELVVTFEGGVSGVLGVRRNSSDARTHRVA